MPEKKSMEDIRSDYLNELCEDASENWNVFIKYSRELRANHGVNMADGFRQLVIWAMEASRADDHGRFKSAA